MGDKIIEKYDHFLNHPKILIKYGIPLSDNFVTDKILANRFLFDLWSIKRCADLFILFYNILSFANYNKILLLIYIEFRNICKSIGDDVHLNSN